MENEKRLIDANLLVSDFAHSPVYNAREFISIKKRINEAPTVDAVEVVRCKDCKHWQPSGSWAGNSEDDLQPIGVCEWANCCRKANDFCSYGERRTDG